jgi:hypothetical protein
MSIIAPAVSLLLLLATAAAKLVVENTSPDELSSMGVERRR